MNLHDLLTRVEDAELVDPPAGVASDIAERLISAGGALGGHLSYAQGAGMFRWQPLRAAASIPVSA